MWPSNYRRNLKFQRGERDRSLPVKFNAFKISSKKHSIPGALLDVLVLLKLGHNQRHLHDRFCYQKSYLQGTAFMSYVDAVKSLMRKQHRQLTRGDYTCSLGKKINFNHKNNDASVFGAKIKGCIHVKLAFSTGASNINDKTFDTPNLIQKVMSYNSQL